MRRTVTRMMVGLAAAAAAAIAVPAAQAAWSVSLIDGAGATAGCTTRTTDAIGYQTITAVYASKLNGFYYDATTGDLRRVVLNGAACPAIQVIDGAGGGGGRVNANVGDEPATSGFGRSLNVFYYDATNGNLRHAWFDGSAWHYEVVDGAGGGRGRVNANVGTWPSTTVFGGKLYVVYANEAARTMRLATWNGSAWSFRTLDGQGGGGRISVAATGGRLGFNTTAVVYSGKVHLFYFYEDPYCDPDFGCHIYGAIREARSADGTNWTFANPVGFPQPGGTGIGGINCCHPGQSLVTVKKSATQQFLIFEGFGVHGSDMLYTVWSGSWGPVGTIEDNNLGAGDLGFHASAVSFSGTPHLFYDGYGQPFDGPRHATWNGTSWHVAQLDSIDDGAPTASTVFGGKIDVLLGWASAAPGAFGDRDLLLVRGP